MTQNKSALFGVTIAIILYLFLSLTYLSLPGLQYDETNFVDAATGQHGPVFIAYEKKILGTKIPLMILSYIGALKSGIFAPIFILFGRSATTVRLPVIIIGLFTLLISYALYQRLFDRKVAIAGLLLFATDPTFVFANKLDWGPVSLMLFLEVSSLYFMWRWIKEEKRRYLTLAGFLFGLGLYNKIIFGWYLAAFFVSMALLFRENFKKLFHSRNLAWFVPALLLGCSPLIAFNIHTRMGTFRRQAVVTSFGREQLKNSYDLFRGTLDGGGTYLLFNRAEVAVHPKAFPNTARRGTVDFFIASAAGFAWVRRSTLPLALALSLLCILFLWARNQLNEKRHILFVAVQLLAIALAISITAEATGAHHVIVLYPFVFPIIAFAFCEFGKWVGNSRVRLSGIITGVALVPVLIPQLVVDARHLHSFRAQGGVAAWSNAIYELVEYVNSNPDKKFNLMDWGFGTQLSLLTDNKADFREFVCHPPNEPAGCIAPLLMGADSLFVFYAPPFGNKALFETYKEVARRNHLTPYLKRTFLQGNGSPVYAVYEIRQPKQESR
jgi:hypothetical protein